MTERRVAIVGGGISGLALAEAVERKSAAAGTPVRAIVLEAERESGGKIRTNREDGFVVETGPHGFLDKEPKMFELIERLGLTPSIIRANEAAARRYIVRAGALREVPSSPPKFLTSDVLPLGGRLRVMFEPFARRAPANEETVHQFASRRIGRQGADVLVDAMVTGIYGGDPKALSLSAAFPRMAELEAKYGGLVRAQLALARERKRLPAGKAEAAGAPAGKAQAQAAGAPAGSMCSFRLGLGELIDALSARAQVRHGYSVERVEQVQGGFRISSAGDALDAQAVALTVPAFDSVRLLSPLVGEVVRPLDEIPYASIAVVVQAFAMEDLEFDPNGFGFLVPGGEGRRILGSIWASSVFPDHSPTGTFMFRTMVGGQRRPDLMDGDDASIAVHALEELQAFLRFRRGAVPRFERIIRWPRGIPQYTLGHASRVAAADAVEAAVPGVFLGGNALRGVAMLACVADADRMADRVIASAVSA